MVKCTVDSCKNDSRKNSKKKSNITFHRFPKDQEIKKKWVDALNKKDFEPNDWSRICSLHFTDSSKFESKKGHRALLKDAVPSLLLDNPENSDNARTFLSLSSPSSSGSCDTPRERKLKRHKTRLKEIIKRRRNRCVALYATQQRLRKKVLDMSQVLNEVQKRKLIKEEQVDLLEVCGASANALFNKMVHKGNEYSPELREFALKLNLYSPKAYSYVRKAFNTCLPHPSTMRKWKQCNKKDRQEDKQDRQEDDQDRQEDKQVRQEDNQDRQEDKQFRQEDDQDRQDRQEDRQDRKEDKQDGHDDRQDRLEDKQDRQMDREDLQEDGHGRQDRQEIGNNLTDFFCNFSVINEVI